jgi:hypothetical protein
LSADASSAVSGTTQSIFSSPWWLDAVAPRRWGDATVSQDGRVAARLPWAEERMPVPGLRLRRVGTHRLTPFLTPELDPGHGKYVTRLAREHQLLDGLIDALPKFDYFSYTLPPSFTNWLPFAHRGFRATLRTTYVLDDLDDLDAVKSAMSDKCRNTIRKAEKLVSVERDERADRLVAMIDSTFARQRRRNPWGRALIERVVEATHAHGAGEILTAVDATGAVHASMLLVYDADRSYYLTGGMNAGLRSSGADSLLLWHAIQHAAERVRVFDFEGSMIPGVARFFRAFGSRPISYLHVTGASRRMRAALAARELGKALAGR